MKGGIDNIKNLMMQALEDSDPRSPILLLVKQSMNVKDIVEECREKSRGQNGATKVQCHSLSKGVLDEVEEKISKAAQIGEWIVLENMHLVLEWAPRLESKLALWKPSEVNTRFRIWITSIPVPDFPRSILERSVKIAL